MKTYQKTVRVGEYLGPVDWSYDFNQHGVNPSHVETGKKVLSLIEKWILENPNDEIWVTESGDFSHRVLQIGMYDGWPWWKPVPHVLTTGVLGPEWKVFYNLVSVRRKPAQPEETTL